MKCIFPPLVQTIVILPSFPWGVRWIDSRSTASIRGIRCYAHVKLLQRSLAEKPDEGGAQSQSEHGERFLL